MYLTVLEKPVVFPVRAYQPGECCQSILKNPTQLLSNSLTSIPAFDYNPRVLGCAFVGLELAPNRLYCDFDNTFTFSSPPQELRSTMKPKTDTRPLEMDLLGLSNSPAELSDEEIVSAYLETRNSQDFERLVKRYERELYTFLRRFLCDVQQAEDVFQATFLSVHLRIDQFEKGRRFRPWLYAIASNKAIDYMRRNRRHQVASLDAKTLYGDSEDSMINHLSGNVATPDEKAISNETGSRVRAALKELSEPTQQLIQLAFYEGMKYSDIAEILHIPLGTVKSRVFTAIRKLNQIWMRMSESSTLRDS